MHTFRSSAPLGSLKITSQRFQEEEQMWDEFLSLSKKLSSWEKKKLASRLALEAVEKSEAPCFLLPSLLSFFAKVATVIPFTFADFEFFLIHHSGLSLEKELELRGKIAGRFLPRADYQSFFPVGSGHFYEGVHIVTSHYPIDLDTTVASFWGWLDAFAAKVGTHLHRWNLPRSGDEEMVEEALIFTDPLGEGAIALLATNLTTLSPTAFDLATLSGMKLRGPKEPSWREDGQEDRHALVVVDERGYFLGDWKENEIEPVLQLLSLLSSLVSSAEQRLLRYALDGKKESALTLSLESLIQRSAISPRLRQALITLLLDLTSLKDPLLLPVIDLLIAIGGEAATFYKQAKELLENHSTDELSLLKELALALEKGSVASLQSLHTLGFILYLKEKTLNLPHLFVNRDACYEEILAKMGSQSFITVVEQDANGMIPIGVIYATALHKKIIGTVSLRDFSNREEVKVPAFFETISIIDHHRSEISVKSPATIAIGDFQSCNVMMAERTFTLSDRYSTGGMSALEIAAELKKLLPKLENFEGATLFHKLARKKEALERKSPYFVAPLRELLEYFAYFFAILDDTDLLTKVTQMDVECVRSLLSRMRLILSGHVCEVASFSDLIRDGSFAKKAAARLLASDECYSLYSRIWEEKERAFSQALKKALSGDLSTLFRDTKEQAGKARVGQVKYYPKNIVEFEGAKERLSELWANQAATLFGSDNRLVLHVAMLSTMPDASELYSGKKSALSHQDELWIWAAPTPAGHAALGLFLRSFQKTLMPFADSASLKALGHRKDELAAFAREWFLPLPIEQRAFGASLIVISHKASALVSRKKDIAPHIL